VFDFKYDGLGAPTLAFNNLSGVGRSGTGTLQVDGNVVATQNMEHTIALVMNLDTEFNIGAPTGNHVDDHGYQIPFAFTGKIDKLTIAVERPKLTLEDEKKLGDRAAQDAQQARIKRGISFRVQPREPRRISDDENNLAWSWCRDRRATKSHDHARQVFLASGRRSFAADGRRSARAVWSVSDVGCRSKPSDSEIPELLLRSTMARPK